MPKQRECILCMQFHIYVKSDTVGILTRPDSHFYRLLL
jgi:hypothetical protein